MARENGRFDEALTETDRAIIAYQSDRDLLGLSEVLSSRQLIFMHLYRKTKDPVYLILEEHAAKASIDAAKLSALPEALGVPYFNLGKYYLEAGMIPEAAEAFSQALTHITARPPANHGAPAEVADVQGHLSYAQYLTGDKTALDRAEKALSDLESADASSDAASYNKNAWLSGAHLRISAMVRYDNPDLSGRHADMAKRIIESDPRLKLRKEQLEHSYAPKK